MKTSAIWAIIVVALLCVNSITLVMVWKQKKPATTNAQHWEAREFLIKKLSLTAQQIIQFDSLRDIHRHKMDSLNGNIRRLKDTLFSKIKDAPGNAKSIGSLTQKIGYDMGLTDSITFYHFRRLRDLLNPVQQKKFDAIIQQVLRMMAPHRMPPNRPGPGNMPQGPPPGPGPEGTPPGGPPPGN